MPLKQLCLGSIESGKGRKSPSPGTVFCEQEWRLVESFYWSGSSGGTFSKTGILGKKSVTYRHF